MRKTCNSHKLRDIVQDTAPVLLKIVKVKKQKQGKSEELSEINFEGDMIFKYNVVSWIGSLNRKRTLMEKPVISE